MGIGSTRAERTSEDTHGIAKAEDSAVLDVQVDACVVHGDAANDLVGIDVGDAGSVVSVRIGTDDVGPASLEVVVLGQEVACDGIGVPGDVDGCEWMDVDGLEAGMGEIGAKPQGLPASVCAGGGDGGREGVGEGETAESEGDGGQTTHGGWGGGCQDPVF